MGSERLVKGI